MHPQKKSHTAKFAVLLLLVIVFAAVQFIPNSSQKEIAIIYPYNDSLFPPEIAPTTFSWNNINSGADLWKIKVEFKDGGSSMESLSENMRWKPDREFWETLKKRSLQKKTTVTVLGGKKSLFGKILTRNQPVSKGSVTISTSVDSVGAPFFTVMCRCHSTLHGRKWS